MYLTGLAVARIVGERRIVWAAAVGAVGWGLAGLTLLPRLDVAAASAWRYSAHACGDRARATYAGVVFVVAALELYGTSIGGPQIANASSPTLRGHRRGTYSRSTCAIASISTSWSG